MDASKNGLDLDRHIYSPILLTPRWLTFVDNVRAAFRLILLDQGLGQVKGSGRRGDWLRRRVRNAPRRVDGEVGTRLQERLGIRGFSGGGDDSDEKLTGFLHFELMISFVPQGEITAI